MRTAWALVLFLFVALGASAQPVEPWTWAWPGDSTAVVSKDDSITVSWALPTSAVRSYGFTDLITLRTDPRWKAALGSMDVHVSIAVKAFTNSDHSAYNTLNDDSLFMSFDLFVGVRGDSLSPLGLDRALDRLDAVSKRFFDAHSYQVNIVDIEVNRGSGYVQENDLPQGLLFDLSLNWERVYLLDLEETITGVTTTRYGCSGITTALADALELEFGWANLDGAIHYDVEWTWVDDYLDGPNGTLSSTLKDPINIEYDLDRNASRATVSELHYRIPLLYDRGFIIWRVRAVGADPDHPEVAIQGDWTGPAPNGMVGGAGSFAIQVAAHNARTNWQTTTSFAEEGKRKVVMTYADGTHRSRQVQSRISSLNVPIIGETVYDAVGRPAVQVMPVPLVKGQCIDSGTPWAPITYIPGFNVEATTDPMDTAYSYVDLIPGDGCGMSADPMGTSNGAERYYSTIFGNDPNALIEAPAFIPQAEQYPFTQTEYTRDNTGRVRSQGGVGPTFQLGGGHATTTYYGKPEQIQLDRLFGSEAGYASHYQRNVTLDPNGQATVTYMDMSGRTIATALTCSAPITMDTVGSANVELTSDLFMGLPSTDSTLHQASGDSLFYTTQFALACSASYSFNYGVIPLDFGNSCWRDVEEEPQTPFCARCVYELDLKLTDACGVVVFELPADPDTLILGSVDYQNDGVMFSCSNAPVHSETFSRDLGPGEYTLTKTLRIHAPARDFYVQELLDTLRNACVVSWPAYLDSVLQTVNTDACFLDCSDCYEAIGSLADYLAAGSGSEQDYLALRSDCDELCKVDSWCDVLYGNMIADMSRQGQYGTYDYNGVDPASFPDRTSVFIPPSSSTYSILRERFVHNPNPTNWKQIDYDKALWRQPWWEKDGVEHLTYLNDAGDRTKIALFFEGGVYTPDVRSTAPEWILEENGFLYTWPENLTNIEDFLDNWQFGWERSLVRFHPEYCYYRDCREYGDPFEFNDPENVNYPLPPNTSDAFDGRLTLAETYANAINDGLLDNNGELLYLTLDPFAVTADFGTYATELHYRYDHYFTTNGTTYSMPKVAAVMARCGGIFPPGPGCANPQTISGENSDIQDSYWATLRGFYRSVKYELQKRKGDNYVNTCDCPSLNYCIGSDEPSTWWSRMQATTDTDPWYLEWLGQPLNQNCQPCNRYRYTHYSSKVPRVADPGQLPGLHQSPMEQAYQNFLATGQCPLATAWQGYFQELFTNELLLTQGTFDITEHSGWVGVYVALNDMEMGTLPPAAEMTVTPSSSGIDLSLNNGCTITLVDPSVTTFEWDSVTHVGQLVADPNSNQFTLALYYNGTDSIPHVVNVEGTMCSLYDLAPCNFPRTCDPNQLARELQDTWNMSKAAGVFMNSPQVLSSTIVPGSGGMNIQSLIGPSITAHFQTSGMSLRWEYSPIGPTIKIKNTGQAGSPALRFEILEAIPASFTFTAGEWATIAYFSNINGDFENFFTIDCMDANDNVIVSLRGQAWFDHSGTSDPVAMGVCGLPPSTTCAGNEYQLDEHIAMVLEDIIYGSSFGTPTVDLFASPEMTDALALAFCPQDSSEMVSLTPPSALGYVTDEGDHFKMKVCNCIDVIVPEAGGVPVGNGLDILGSNFANDPDNNNTFTDLYIPILPGGTQFVHVISHCLEFLPCDTCAPEQVPTSEYYNLTEQQMIAQKILSVDSIWMDYVAYKASVDSLNDRLDLNLGDSAFVASLNYADFRRNGYWHSLPAYQQYIRNYKPGIDETRYLHYLDSFVVAQSNAVNVKREFERYIKTVEYYNGRAIAGGKPTITPIGDSLFTDLMVADDLAAYVNMIYARRPRNTLPITIQQYASVDPNDPCVQLYRNTYLPAYWALENATTDTTGRCPGFEKYAPLASYKEFFAANLCCSDSGLLVLDRYLQRFLNDSLKCPGELPRLKECPEASTQSIAQMLSEEEECQRLYLLWYDAIKEYLYPPVEYYTYTGYELELTYTEFESFIAAGLCACVQEYLLYLEDYLKWKVGDDPLPKILSIDEFCNGVEVDCEDLYFEYVALIDSFNVSVFSDVHEFDLKQHYDKFEDFEKAKLCVCVEAYLAYLQGYLVWNPNSTGDWPNPLDIEKFCGMQNPEDCEGQYDYYVNHLISLQPMLVQIDSLYGLQFYFKVPKEELFLDYQLCWCVDAYLAWVDLLLADPERYLTEMQGNSSVWNLMDYCAIPVPCEPLPPLEPTPEINVPAGENDCVRALLDAANLNAQNGYAAYLHHLTTDIRTRYDSICLSAPETFTVTFDDYEHHFTLYYYDQAGSLVRTVPPEGVLITDIDHHLDSVAVRISRDRANGTHSFFTDHRMASDHVYNSLGQPIRSSMPDQDPRQEWESDSPEGLPLDLNITGVSFGSGGNGFLSGTKNTTPPRGMVYHTDDGGLTWHRSNGLVGADLYGSHYLTATDGYAVGDQGTLLRSTNSGGTWDLVAGDLLSSRPNLRNAYFNTSTQGLVIGLNGVAKYTNDGGITFSNVSLPNANELLGIGFSGTDYVVGGIAPGDTSGLFHAATSLNGPWFPVPHARTFAGLTCGQSLTSGAVIVGGKYGVLLKRLNGTTDWTTLRTGTTADFIDMVWLNDQRGVAIVDSLSATSNLPTGIGVLRHTSDGGATWQQFNDCPAVDLNDLFLYNSTTNLAQAVAVGQNGRVIRVNIGIGGSSITVVSGMPTSAHLSRVWAGAGTDGVRCLVVDGTSTVRSTRNLSDMNVTWESNALTGGYVAKDVVGFPLPGAVNGLLAVSNGSNFKYVTGNWDLSTTPATHTWGTNQGANVASLAIKSNGTAIISSATEPIEEVDLSVAVPVATTLIASIPSAATTVAVVPATSNSLISVGNDGSLFEATTGTPTYSWTDRSAQIAPLPIYAVDKAGTVAVGAQGTVFSGEGSAWSAIPTRTKEDLNALALTSADLVVAAGANGACLRLDPTLPYSTYTALTLPQGGMVHSAAITGDDLYLGGDNGRIWHSAAISAPTPVFTSMLHNSGSIRSLSAGSGSTVIAFGDQALVQSLIGESRFVNYEVYTPPLNGVWFRDANYGYVVGTDNSIRHTVNGGQSWAPVPITDSPRTTFRSVSGSGQHKPIAVGDGLKAVSLLAAVPTTISLPGSSLNLQDVAMAKSGATIIVGANTAGTTGLVYRRSAGATSWTTDLPLGAQGLYAAAVFEPYMFDEIGIDNESSTEDFIVGGTGGRQALYRYTPATGSTGTIALVSGFNNAPTEFGGGTIRDFYFHDRVSGYALVQGGTAAKRMFRIDVAPLAHDGAFTWLRVDTLTGDLATENTVLPTCMAFSDRNHGFVGGAHAGGALGLARTINDEGALYSQRFWYDALGRLVVSQNSKQYAMDPRRYSYSLYDELGRVYEAGELEDGPTTDRFLDLPPTDVNGDLLPNVIDPDVLNVWVQARDRFEVTRTQYDTPLPGLSVPDLTQKNLRLRVASTFYYANFNSSTPLVGSYAHATHYSYDIHGNVNTLVQDHPQLRADAGTACTGCRDHQFKHINYTYDLISGNVKQVDYQKGQPDAFAHKYEYDADNRITLVETSADGSNWHTDATYFYYPHGPLQRVELGAHIVQGIDYAYTLQGWLKGINSNLLQPGNDMGHDGDQADGDLSNDLIGRDAYALSLGYYGDADYKAIGPAWNTVADRPFAPIGSTGISNTLANENKPLYNGNISHTTNTLQPFTGWNSGATQGQVLAQVYHYDQLNRLRATRGIEGLTAANTWVGVNDAATNKYRSEYTFDANGNIETAKRFDQTEAGYDEFSYHYYEPGSRKKQNRLYELFDASSGTTGSDLPASSGTFDTTSTGVNTLNNYGYDALGNLIRDTREEIDVIDWTVSGKVRSVLRTNTSTRKPLFFEYGASGQRIMKQVSINPDLDSEGYREHYVRDAQGNTMAIYRYQSDGALSLKVKERPLYGSSRIGAYKEEVELHSVTSWSDPANPMQQVDLNYELSDHLGNVTSVVTGRLLNGNGAGTLKQPELLSASGYEPGGSLLPGRNYSSTSYAYGFNGMRKDDEIHGAAGTSYDFGARLYDPRVGRWLSLDPLASNFAGWSPYSFSLCNPILLKDPDGKEPTRTNAVSLSAYVAVLRSLNVRDLNQLKNTHGTWIGGLPNKYNDQLKERYLYSPKWGWIDMKHVATAANDAARFGDEFVLQQGENVEARQEHQLFPNSNAGSLPSAWDYEDLVSNAVGVGFKGFLGTDAAKDRDLITNLEIYLGELGFGSPTDAPNFGELPADHGGDTHVTNYTYEPMYAPKANERTGTLDKALLHKIDKHIKTAGGGADRRDSPGVREMLDSRKGGAPGDMRPYYDQ